MFQRMLLAVITAILVFLASCVPPQATLEAQPILPPKAPCEDVLCDATKHCDVGQCVCNTGLKVCGDQCIDARACCITKDCGSGRSCVNGACVEHPMCDFNAVWDDQRQECTCNEDAKFCPEQGKCIPEDHCCTHEICDDDQRCAATTYAGTVCMKSETKKCRVVHEGRTVSFFLVQGDFDVQVQNILEDAQFDLMVNNQSISRVNINQSKTVDNNLDIYVENLLVFGGNCREEPD